jgi:hypothetical protein
LAGRYVGMQARRQEGMQESRKAGGQERRQEDRNAYRQRDIGFPLSGVFYLFILLTVYDIDDYNRLKGTQETFTVRMLLFHFYTRIK